MYPVAGGLCIPTIRSFRNEKNVKAYKAYPPYVQNLPGCSHSGKPSLSLEIDFIS